VSALIAVCELWAGTVAAAALDLSLSGPSGKPAANTVVLIHNLDDPVGMPDLPTPAVTVVQQGQMFAPAVSVVHVGTRVRFPNFDRMRHHVYSFSTAKRFELRLYSGEQVPHIDFDRTGIVVVGCNIHDWMEAYIYVTDAGAAAVTDAGGTARFPSLPAGRYRIDVWHPPLEHAVAARELTLANGAHVRATIALESPVAPIDQSRPHDDPLAALFEATLDAAD
jgi:plastocyanin